jgi:hypothetical protein
MDAGLFGLLDLLKEKSASDEWRGASLMNYLFHRHEDFFSERHNSFLLRIFEEQRDRSLALFRARGVS